MRIARFRLHVSLSAAFVLAALFPAAWAAPPAASILYVAADGNDSWSGRLAAANVEKSDGPFATPERAREELRRLRRARKLSSDGATVVVRGGAYYLKTPLELTEEDSGAPGARVVWAAWPGEEVRLSGGRPIRGFTRITDPAVQARLGRPEIRQADLKEQGVTDYGPVVGTGPALHCYDQPMRLARSLPEVDAPGEYYVDRTAGLLYLWAPSWLDSSRAVIPVLDNLVILRNVSHLALSGFILEAARGTAVRIEGGAQNLIERCVMRNLGGSGVSVTGEGHRIAKCEIYQVGKTGPPAGGGKGDPGVRAALERIPGALAALAREARLDKDFDLAHALFGRAAAAPDQDAASRAGVRLEWGNMLIEAGRAGEARLAFGTAAADAEAPAGRRSLALLQVARSFACEKDYDGAIVACQKVKAIPGVPPHHVWEAEEAAKELARVKTGLPARDPAAARTRPVLLPKPGRIVFVSPRGNDANPGTAARPIATLARAVEEVRRIRREGPPKGGIRIEFQGGAYPLARGVKMDADASGTKESPVVFTAAAGQSVIFRGGVRISGFERVTDPAILARLPQEGRGRTLRLDLKKRRITQYGVLTTRGFGVKGHEVSSLELFFNGKPMTPARWPNKGFLSTGKVLDRGEPGAARPGRFLFDSPRLERWAHARDMMLYGYWYWDWADNAVAVARVDPAAKEIEMRPGAFFGVREGQRFRAFNLLEEIDAPGEWYLDREAGVLYFFPPEDPSRAVIELSMVEEPLLTLTGASHVVLQGLTFELGRGDGVIIEGGESCLVAGCTLRRFGATGLTVRGGANHLVLSSELHTLGRGGFEVIGGDRAKLTPAGHVIENCAVHDFGRIDRTYTPAFQVEGVGIRIAHNRAHNAPSSAFRIEGNDHLIEFNEVYNVVRESDDQGAVDIFRNPTYRGNVIRYNLWRDIGGDPREAGVRPTGEAGIRLDDAISGTVVYGNVFLRASGGSFGGVQIHAGKDNWIENNLFVDCRFGITVSPWTEKRWREFVASDEVKGFQTAVRGSEPPYSARYPELARLLENPFRNRIWRNLAVNSTAFLHVRGREARQDELDNYVTRTDPGFLDRTGGGLAWRAEALGPRLSSFRPIPISEIGLYFDQWRPKPAARQRK